MSALGQADSCSAAKGAYSIPVGNMQGYLNLKGYKEFAAQNRPDGWNAWLTFAISPAAPSPASSASRGMIKK
jgi:hypothetical protein